MEISPGPSAAVRVHAVGCRTSSRLRCQPLEFWRNEERPKDTAPQRLEFADPEAHRCRAHRRALPAPQGSVAEALDKVTKQRADSATHAESLHRIYDNGAAASMPADPDVLPSNVYNSRTQREPLEEQEQPKRIGENSRGRCRKVEKVRDGASPDRNSAGHTVAATKLLPSVRLPSQTTRRAAHAVVAADQTTNTHLSPDFRQADTGVAQNEPTQNEAGHHLGNAASAVAGSVPVTTAARAAGSGAAEVPSAVAWEDAGKVLAAGTPAVKSGIRRTRGDPVLRSPILVRDMAEALGQIAGPGSASDQDRIGARRSRKAAHNVQLGKLTAAQKGSLGVAAAAPETAGTKMTANVPARVQLQKPEDVSPAQSGADVVTKCDEEQCHMVSFVRTRPTHQAAPRNREPPRAPLKMKSKSKSASNPKAKAKSTGSSAAAAGTRRPKRQQQLPPGLSLPAAREPEQDVDEEEAYRPRKRAREATVQEPGDPDARERSTGSAAGHESERDSERTLCTRVCTKPWAATVAEVCRQQVAKESATAEDMSAVRGHKKRCRKPKKASAAEAWIAAQPTSQPEPNISSQQAAPGDAGGSIGDAGPGKAPEEALGNAPAQIREDSVPSVMTSVGDGSRDCKAAVCAETLLQAAERIAPQRGTSVQHQEEQPANLAGDQHMQQHLIHEPDDGHWPSLIVDDDGVEVWRASGEATREKRLVHGNGESTSQQPGTARAEEMADGSGGIGNRQESGRTAEDGGRNAAGGPSQPTRRVPLSPAADAGTTLSPLDVHEADGGLPCCHARPHAVMHAEHDLQPRSGPSAPASLFSKVQSIRRALQLEGELKKLTLKWRQAIVDCEEDGWTPDQVRDLQAAYYNTDPTLPNFWREVAKGVRGRTAAECFNRVFGSAQDGEDRALFAKVLRRHNPIPAAGGGAGRPLTLAAARKRSQKAHEQELQQFIACVEGMDAESKPDEKNGVHAGGSCAREPAGDRCHTAVKEPWEHCLHDTEPTLASNCANEVGPAVNTDWREDDMYDGYSTEELEEDEDQE